MDILSQFLLFIGSLVWNFLAITWWFWLFIIIAALTHSAWFFWRKSIYKEETEFILLEIRIPREIQKNPRAMEQVLTAIHSLRNAPGTLAEKWWDGEITRWYSLEIVTFGGETHFYVRVYFKQKALMEAAFLSYYPDLELVEVEDYAQRLPQNVEEMHEQGYDIWGSDVVLSREAAYPIKTYTEFESPDENKQYDTMSSFLELFSSLKREEIIGFQILIAPTDQDWWKKWEGLLKKLSTKEEERKKLGTATSFPSDIGIGVLPMFEVTRPDKDDMKFLKTAFRTPGETEILEAVGKNLSKPAFDTIIRFIYLSPKSMYMDSIPRRGVQGVLNQFSALNLNTLVRNDKTAVGAPRVLLFHFPYIFPKKRGDIKKARILHNYIKREIPEDEFIGKLMTSNIFNWNKHTKWFEMNTECLATIFHPPSIMSLTAPHIKRVESKKGGPPAGLAIFGGEENVEKLQ
ncbi:MAG TPA: hypothetical protein VMV71_03275 [Candidatus Paceibacterota bacterium]|nr:hypothetical protein [Candidatus Paceibacterota bacterium]